MPLNRDVLMDKHLSSKLISRLTMYHCVLVDYLVQGFSHISSIRLSQLLKIDDSQIRKDIKLLNYKGKCKVGYAVVELKEIIEKKLTFAKTKDVFIVGAGNLGFALAKSDNFGYYGFKVLALFDNSDLKVGLSFEDKQVFHISQFPDLAQKLQVEIAILTVPYEQAQQTADFLINAGIKYIWNFTQAILVTPTEVKVWNENLIGHFLQLTLDQ